MGFGLASSPILTWSRASSLGGSRCSKRISHNMFRCLIQGSSSESISSISSSFSSGWAETMLTETGSNNVPTLTSELKKGVGGVVVPCQRFGVHVRLVQRGAVPQSSVVLPAAGVVAFKWCFAAFAAVQAFLIFEAVPPTFHHTDHLRGDP